MNKRIKILSSMFLISLCSCLIAGCSSCSKTPDEEPKGEQYIAKVEQGDSINFISKPSTMYVADMTPIVYALTGELKKENLTFVSSNPSVAVVNSQGAIDAINAGTATITLKCGAVENSFEVTVVADDTHPQLQFENAITEESIYTVVRSSSINLGAKIFYRQREFSDCEVSYTLSDPAMATITADGILTPRKKGQITVDVEAQWRGMQSPLLKKTVTIDVVDEFFVLEGTSIVSSIDLYTMDTFKGNEYETTFDVGERLTVMLNGADVTENASFSVANSEVVDWNNTSKVLTSVARGSTTLNISVNTDDGLVSTSVLVDCLRPVAEYQQELYFSKVDGNIVELAEIFGEEVVLEDAYQGERALTVNNNIITGLQVATGELANTEISVYTQEYGYKLKLKVADKVIRTHNDLEFLATPPTDGAARITGYVVLANDILWGDTSAEQYISDQSWTNGPSTYNSKGFGGTFDGQGYTIEFGLANGGLFGSLGGATVKNTSFIVKQGPASIYNPEETWRPAFNVILARYASNVTLENVYAKYDTGVVLGDVTQWGTGLGLFGGSNFGTLKNVIVDLTAVNEQVKPYYENGTLNAGSSMQAFGSLFSVKASGWYPPSSITNSYVYSAIREICICPTGEKLWVTESDYAAYSAAVTSGTGYENAQYSGYVLDKVSDIYRFDSAAASKTYFDSNPEALAAFDWLNISAGYPTL